MGMYTEVFINVDLKKETPDEVVQVLSAICRKLDKDTCEKVLEKVPQRWEALFSNCSYYTPSTCCKYLEFDDITQRWSLLGKGDIKNYSNEIEEFFEWIMPWVDAWEGEFIGYSRYEEAEKPTLIFKSSSRA